MRKVRRREEDGRRQGVEEENVAETDAVEKTMESMINLDGATPAVPDIVRLLRPAHDQDRQEISETSLPALRRPVERASIRKTPAAISAISTKRQYSPASSRATPPRAEARLRRRQADPAGAAQHQRLRAGRQLANPKATTQVIFTGDWSMPVKEAEATNSLIDQGVDVLTCHVDSPKVMVETAARRGAMSAAITATSRRSRRKAISPAPNGTGRRCIRSSSR